MDPNASQPGVGTSGNVNLLGVEGPARGNFGARVSKIHIPNKVDQDSAGGMKKMDIPSPG